MKVLTFSNLYPSSVNPRHGIFVEQRLRHVTDTGQVQAAVMAPVPWFPLAARISGRYRELARIGAGEVRAGIPVSYPRYLHLPLIGMPIAPYVMARSLRGRVGRQLRESGAEVIDAHFLYPDGVAACLLGEWFDIPVVLTARGSDVNLFGQYRIPRAWISWAVRRSSRTITVSEALRLELLAFDLPPEKILTLRNGVDLDVFQPLDKSAARADIGAASPLLLSVGNLVGLKGHDRVIRALTALPDAELIIVGKGPDEPSLRRLVAALNLDARVRFVGHVPQADLPEYYCAADALVQASEREGMPNVVLESLACGTPVIASAVGGVPEIIRAPAAGILLDSRDPEAIAAACRTLLAAPPDQFSTRSTVSGFGWPAITEGVIGVLSQAVARGG